MSPAPWHAMSEFRSGTELHTGNSISAQSTAQYAYYLINQLSRNTLYLSLNEQSVGIYWPTYGQSSID